MLEVHTAYVFHKSFYSFILTRSGILSSMGKL